MPITIYPFPIYPFPGTLDPAVSIDDSLSAILREKTIIGLGEATHGTPEFGKHKLKLVQYVVERGDFSRLFSNVNANTFLFKQLLRNRRQV